MSKKPKTTAKLTVTKRESPKKVKGRDTLTHKVLYCLPDTPGFTPDK